MAVLGRPPADFARGLLRDHPALFSGAAAPFRHPALGPGTFGSVATSLTTGITSFVNNILVGRIVPVMAAALCFKAILDSSEGHSPCRRSFRRSLCWVRRRSGRSRRLGPPLQQYHFHRSVLHRRHARRHVQLPGHDHQPVCCSPVLHWGRNQLPTLKAMGRRGLLRARISEFYWAVVTRYGLDGSYNHMVNNTNLTKLASSSSSRFSLSWAAIAVAILARFRVGLIALRVGLRSSMLALFSTVCR